MVPAFSENELHPTQSTVLSTDDFVAAMER
jgi:hypothetical protein